MKKFTAGLLNKRKSSFLGSNGTARTNSGNDNDYSNAPTDSPEANAGRGVRLFCESGSMSNGGEEVLHLPVIVDAAESSPAAAAAAARQIRKFLTKEWANKPHVQYNSIMLMRILSDNPGPSFTRNFDKSFVSTVKEVLRNCKDPSTQQILRETLDTFEANKQYQEGMELLIAMWRKEKGQQASFAGQHGRPMPSVARGYGAPNGYEQRPPGPGRARSSRHNRLPAPEELASRVEEAKNSAKILLQLLQSTPAEEVVGNDLIKEFNERCQSAQRSMQGYINCDNPAPDDDTMLTLIETNEQLSLSSTRYQRALLAARRAMGLSASPGHETMAGGLGTSGVSNGAPLAQGESQSAFGPPSSGSLGGQQQQYLPPIGNMSAFASPMGSNGDPDYQAPMGPPPPRNPGRGEITTTNHDDYQSPPGPPPLKSEYRGAMSAFASPASKNDDYYVPPGPPPSHNQQSQPPPPQSDPFADPAEHESNPAPSAYDTNKYDRSTLVTPPDTRPPQSSNYTTEPAQQHSPQSMYDTSPQNPRRPGSGAAPVSPNSPERRRQWGGQGGQDGVSEIDGHSNVGRGGNSGDDGAQRGYGY